MTFGIIVKKDSLKSVQSDFDWYNSGKGFIVFEIPIIYSSVLNSSEKYITMISYKIYKDDIEFVKSEIE
jgi:hypothetical protein